MLNNNDLSGALPPEIGSLSSLSVLCAPRTGMPRLPELSASFSMCLL